MILQLCSEITRLRIADYLTRIPLSLQHLPDEFIQRQLIRSGQLCNPVHRSFEGVINQRSCYILRGYGLYPCRRQTDDIPFCSGIGNAFRESKN